MKLKIYTKEELGLFPLYCVTCDFDYKQERISRPNGFYLNQIFLVRSGEGVLVCGGRSYDLRKNDMFYIEANTPHEYYGTGDNFRISYMGFFGSGFDAIRKYYGLSEYGVYNNRSNKTTEKALMDVFGLFDTPCELPVLCSAAFSAVAVFFDRPLKKEYCPIETVMGYLERNWDTDMTLSEILEFYPYSKSKLCSDFKKTYGVTIFEMLIKVRLKHARYMITNDPSMRLAEVSHSCGFNDVSYFCKMYKRYYGTSPKSSRV